MSAHELLATTVREVLYNTGITATAGIGTNLYLAAGDGTLWQSTSRRTKTAVRIAELDEQSYRYSLWNHRPLTDFCGDIAGPRHGQAAGSSRHGTAPWGTWVTVFIHGETSSRRRFSRDAETLIDHAWGYEPRGMAGDRVTSPAPTASVRDSADLPTPMTAAHRPNGGNSDVPLTERTGDGIHHLGDRLRPGERGQVAATVVRPRPTATAGSSPRRHTAPSGLMPLPPAHSSSMKAQSC